MLQVPAGRFRERLEVEWKTDLDSLRAMYLALECSFFRANAACSSICLAMISCGGTQWSAARRAVAHSTMDAFGFKCGYVLGRQSLRAYAGADVFVRRIRHFCCEVGLRICGNEGTHLFR
jgi:hypothetical protein